MTILILYDAAHTHRHLTKQLELAVEHANGKQSAIAAGGGVGGV